MKGNSLKSTNPLEAYRETQIKTANQGKLIVMLYDGAIKNLNLAIENISSGHTRFDVLSKKIVRAQDIIAELMVSLDFNAGGDIAKNLFSLYLFMNRMLLEANIEKKEQPLQSVKDLLLELREAWVEVAQRSEKESENSREGGVNIAG